MKLLIKISYLGTDYCGYQVQPNGVSVQQKLNEAAKALFGCDCDIVGCSRTDSGVHAKEFCATVSKQGYEDLQTAVPIEKIPLALSAHLPPDISVFAAEWVKSDFHARYDVKEKEYLYRIYNRSVRDPFYEGRAAHIPRHIGDEDLLRMQEAAALFIGEHDFSSFMAQGSKVASTVRNITRSEVFREGDMITYRVAANGFLYNMVRIIMGTLMNVAEGKLSLADVKKLLNTPNDRKNAGPTMPPEGLYLNRVIY